jgi:hypothetical protein
MIDPTKNVTASVNEFRMRFLRLNHGATDDMSDDSVPADRRDDFHAEVESNLAYAADWFERKARLFGSEDGTWAGVPKGRRAEALQFFGREIAANNNRCEFELDLLRIEQAEAASPVS